MHTKHAARIKNLAHDQITGIFYAASVSVQSSSRMPSWISRQVSDTNSIQPSILHNQQLSRFITSYWENHFTQSTSHIFPTIIVLPYKFHKVFITAFSLWIVISSRASKRKPEAWQFYYTRLVALSIIMHALSVISGCFLPPQSPSSENSWNWD